MTGLLGFDGSVKIFSKYVVYLLLYSWTMRYLGTLLRPSLLKIIIINCFTGYTQQTILVPRTLMGLELVVMDTVMVPCWSPYTLNPNNTLKNTFFFRDTLNVQPQ